MGAGRRGGWAVFRGGLWAGGWYLLCRVTPRGGAAWARPSDRAEPGRDHLRNGQGRGPWPARPAVPHARTPGEGWGLRPWAGCWGPRMAGLLEKPHQSGAARDSGCAADWLGAAAVEEGGHPGVLVLAARTAGPGRPCRRWWWRGGALRRASLVSSSARQDCSAILAARARAAAPGRRLPRRRGRRPGVGGVEARPGVEHAAGDRRPASWGSRQLAPAPARMPRDSSGWAKNALARGDAEVAGQRQLAAAAERRDRRRRRWSASGGPRAARTGRR